MLGGRLGLVNKPKKNMDHQKQLELELEFFNYFTLIELYLYYSFLSLFRANGDCQVKSTRGVVELG